MNFNKNSMINPHQLAELQANNLANGSSGIENENANDEKIRQQEEFKHTILSQILDQEARGRLNTLKLSKPEKGQMVEMHLIHMAQVGRIREKLNDKQLVEILINLNAKMPDNVSKVKYDRRRAAIDSDDEDNYGC